MKLSVCLIVRNEESRLAAAIESVRAVADEIVITDTGSTDQTVAIARSMGAKVAHFEWSDDFAAARNHCWDQARGEWIFWLDADERLKPGSDSEVRRCMNDPGLLAAHVIREDNFAAERSDWFSEMYQLRLMRRDMPARFTGRIHEHLNPDPIHLIGQSGGRIAGSQIRLQHWGYTKDRVVEKWRRAVHLIDLELSERPGQLYYLIELTRTLFVLNDPRGPDRLTETCQIMLRSRQDPRPPTLMIASLFEFLLSMPGQTFLTEDELINLSTKWFPSNAPLCWALARVMSVRGDWDKAEAQLRHLLEMLRNGTHDRYLSFDPRLGEDAEFNLGVCLVRQAKLHEAKHLFTSLLQSPRRSGDARQNLDVITRLLGQFRS